MFSGTINLKNKDTLIHLAKCMLINLDELEKLNRTEIGTLKELNTKTHIRKLKTDRHSNETLPRRASFAGSVNTAQFLNDNTGSHRFLCFEVEHIEYTHNIDLNMVYAQAIEVYKNDFSLLVQSGRNQRNILEQRTIPDPKSGRRIAVNLV